MQKLDKTQMDTLHQLELKIALEIKRVCQTHGIKFFLIGGSLLGAVRHKGFVPWDDDMDVAMPREDYERFVKAFPATADMDTFFLQNWNTEPEFGLPFSKVMLRGTAFEEHSSSALGLTRGIFVDVFPLDKMTANPDDLERSARRLDKLVKLYKFGRGYLPTKPNNRKQHVMARVIGLAGCIIPKKVLQDRIIREATRFNSDDRAENVALLAGTGNQLRLLFSLEAIQTTVDTPFESETMPIPAGYDTVLKRQFGDYMTPPPPDQRGMKHFPERVDFGKYGVPEGKANFTGRR